MKRNYWMELGPSLLVAAGILLSSFIEVHTEKTGGSSLLAPLVMGLALVGGVLLDPRWKGRVPRRVWLSLITACWVLIVASLLTAGSGRSGKAFLPAMGAAMWAALLSGSRRRVTCSERV